ncbi:M24 family metallopeptidase [Tepidibacillus fermentans]|uniref:Xaa-Pro aminopeptidase n=1 Tax=Tepidibacillus fermentans TaxID=1281767 RepID=A0A4R3KM59_9BACI|nr:Xaa-Pro peptidase family protein [Tepidibacillus fermentans]TCS84018.1 Xaa-Pro aminopeptidase [Tepidibacillus fermentans]
MEKRIKRLREELKERNLDGILITHSSNRRYITGFTGSAGNVLVTQHDAFLVTDFRYTEQAAEQAKYFTIVNQEDSMLKKLKELVAKTGIHTLGFEQDYVPYSQYKQFEENFQPVTLVPLSQVLESIRMIKDEQEIQLIRKAAVIADQAFSHVLKVIKPGMREIEVALELECKMRQLGAQGASFDTIVASGVRSALPHGVASDKVIEVGDFVTMDFGAIYQGYVSDITRTIAIGKVNEKQREIHNIVLEAQLNGVHHVKAGMTGKEADALTRSIISRYGYGEYFGHSTGHGIGLDVHEGPGLSMKSEVILKPGMIVTIEPGIYISKFGGVRIEDDVLITEHGVEVLTHSPKELIIIE